MSHGMANSHRPDLLTEPHPICTDMKESRRIAAFLGSGTSTQATACSVDGPAGSGSRRTWGFSPVSRVSRPASHFAIAVAGRTLGAVNERISLTPITRKGRRP